MKVIVVDDDDRYYCGYDYENDEDNTCAFLALPTN